MPPRSSRHLGLEPETLKCNLGAWTAQTLVCTAVTCGAYEYTQLDYGIEHSGDAANAAHPRYAVTGTGVAHGSYRDVTCNTGYAITNPGLPTYHTASGTKSTATRVENIPNLG